MDRKKRIIYIIISSFIALIGAVGLSIGIYFANIKPPLKKLILNTFYVLDKDKSRWNWEIDLLDYKVEFINYSENNSSDLKFRVDDTQGFYDDCISPYISSFLTEYTRGDMKVKLFFYDKAPIYYSEKNGTISMYSFGNEPWNGFLTPFFQDPKSMDEEEPVILDYPSSNMDYFKRYNLFYKEVGLHVKLTDFNDAKSIFEEHLDPNSFSINIDEKSITSYYYNRFSNYENDQQTVYCDFDKNIYAKYTFNENNISFSYHDNY